MTSSSPEPGWRDVAMFAARAARLDPQTLIRVQPGPSDEAPSGGYVHLWSILPLKVLAHRAAEVTIDSDATFRSGDFGSEKKWPANRYDSQWRAALPNSRGEVIETIPTHLIEEALQQATEALEARRGGSVGDRRLRDALLDHETLHIQKGDLEYKVQLRLLIAAARMGFIGDDEVWVRLSGRRIGLEGTHGIIWQPDTALRLL